MEVKTYDPTFINDLGKTVNLTLSESVQKICVALKKQNNVVLQAPLEKAKRVHKESGGTNVSSGWRDGTNLVKKKVIVTPENPKKKELYLLLNKLSDSNYEIISRQFDTLIRSAKSKDLYGAIVDRLFECAVVQIYYCTYYAKLCKYCLDNDTDTLLVSVLLPKVSSQLDNLDTYRKTVSAEDYNSFCEDMSWKNRHIGCYQFIAELYNYRVVTTDKMRDVIANLVGSIESETVKFKIEILIEAFNKLLTCICESVERVEADCQFLLEQGQYLLENYSDKMNMRSQIILENHLEKYAKIIQNTDS
jgi:hypothetical protein